jgi:hypothetical protein
MDIRAMVLQMIGLQKASVGNGFAVLTTIQDEAERITNDFMDQAGWIPSASKGVMREWFGLVKKSRNDLRKAVDDSYAQMGGYVDTAFQRTFKL